MNNKWHINLVFFSSLIYSKNSIFQSKDYKNIFFQAI